MNEPPYSLDEERRAVVLSGIQKVTVRRAWNLIAAHVRQAHVHLVVDLQEYSAQRALGDCKAYATLVLKQAGLDVARRHRWARFGSTIPLRDRTAVLRAIRYVIEEQGTPMATFLHLDGHGI